MSISDLFGSGEHLRNLGHFASIVNLAAVDGEINQRERLQLEKFASKLDISEEEYLKVLKKPHAFPVQPNNSVQERLERLHDLFKIIFADHEIDKAEEILLKKYAVGLGFSPEVADSIIKRSIDIFSGQISFEDYKYLLYKEE